MTTIVGRRTRCGSCGVFRPEAPGACRGCYRSPGNRTDVEILSEMDLADDGAGLWMKRSFRWRYLLLGALVSVALNLAGALLHLEGGIGIVSSAIIIVLGAAADLMLPSPKGYEPEAFSGSPPASVGRSAG